MLYTVSVYIESTKLLTTIATGGGAVSPCPRLVLSHAARRALRAVKRAVGQLVLARRRRRSRCLGRRAGQDIAASALGIRHLLAAGWEGRVPWAPGEDSRGRKRVMR